MKFYSPYGQESDKLPTISPSQSPVTQSEKEVVDDIGNSLIVNIELQ